MNIIFQSPLELIFKHGSWNDLSINKTECDIRKQLIPFFNQKTIKEWNYLSDRSNEFYSLMTQFLNCGYNDRFLLYCPVEIIPDLSIKKINQNMNQNMKDFVKAYFDCWIRTLQYFDVRANFIDGDIPDAELLIRFTPKIVQSMFIAEHLHKKKLLATETFWAILSTPRFKSSFDDLISRSLPSHALLCLSLRIDYSNINKYISDYLQNAVEFVKTIEPEASQKRIKWLISETKMLSIEAMAQNLKLDYLNDYDDLSDDAIDVVVGAIAHQFQNNNKIILNYFDKLLSWKDRDSVRHLICKLYNYDKSYNYLNDFGYTCPDLSTNYEINNLPFDISNINQLDHLIYPVAILYGSRIKGYASTNSDYDIAVVLREHVNDEHVFMIDEFFGQKVLKFKTKVCSNTCTIKIVKHNNHDPLSGSAADSHVLFNGVWVGDELHVNFLFRNLLCNLPTNGDVYRSSLERDLLQYRLLHNGYARFNFVNEPTFFNVGYRCVASKLYLSKIFDIKHGCETVLL